MKSKILAFLLPAACGAALAITLSVAAAEQPPTSARDHGNTYGNHASESAQLQQPPAASSAPAATPPQQYAEYRNDQWHFSIDVPSNLTAVSTGDRTGATIQFTDPQGNEPFQITAVPYSDLDVALGEEAPAANAGDQPSTLNIVHVFHADLFEVTFQKNGVSYLVQAVDADETSTLDILKSWQFI